MELSSDQSALKIKELESRLEEYEQLIEAIKAGEVDAFALNKNNKAEIYTLQSGDYAYRMLVETFGEGALNLSEETLIVYTNNYFPELLKLPYESVIGKSFIEFIHSDSVEVFNGLFKKGFAGQSKGEINLYAGEKIIPVYISLTSLHPTLHTVGLILTDLTEKKEHQKILMQNQELMLEKKLIEQNENELQELVKHAPVAIVLYEGENLIVKVANTSALQLMDKNEKDVLNRPMHACFPDAKEREEIYKTVFRTGIPYNGSEVKVTFNKSGKSYTGYYDLNYTPWYDNNKRIKGVMSVGVEVTEGVLSRRKVEESEKRYNMMLMQSPFAFAIFKGKDMIISLANDSMKAVLGKGMNIEGKPLLKVLPELVGQPFPGYLVDVYNTGVPFSANGERAKLLRNGKIEDTYFNFVYQPYREVDGTISGVTCIAYDVTREFLAQKQIQESEQKFRLLADSMPQHIWTADNEGNVFYYNQSILDYSGLTPDQIMKDGLIQIIHPDDREGSINTWGESVSTGKQFLLEHRFRKHTGEYRWQLSRAIPQKDELGNIQMWVGTSTDIQDQKSFAEELENQVKERTKDLIQLNETLRKSEERYHLMVEEVQDYAIIYLNRDGVIENWNEGAEKIKGYKASEIIGKSFSNFYTTEDKRNNLPHKLLTKAAETGRALQEGWRVRKDGSLFWASVVITAIHNEKNELIGYSKVTHDLTEKKNAEESLKKSAVQLEKYNTELENQNEKLEERNDFISTLVNSSVDIILVVDKELKFISANNKAIDFYSGIYKGSIIGKRVSEVLPKSNLKEILNAFKGASVFTDKFKSTFSENYYELNYIPLLKKNEVYAVMIIFHEITDIILKQEELERLNKELQSFTYISSHDLQEPLRKIQTFATRILEKEENNLSENGKDNFKRMQDAAKRMQTLITDLLTYSRTNTSERKFETISLNKIIDEVKEDLKDDIEEKHAIIDVGKLCDINIISFQFRQLMLNLIGNSLKFSNREIPPHIKISSKIVEGEKVNTQKLTPQKKYCHISIIDNGIGFDQQYSKKIFEVFQRLHGKTEYNGTGIGLSIVKKIVENHNGIITATGELNKGASFDIYIPALDNYNST